MAARVNKRDILQAILDQKEELWIIIKPSRLNPRDPDYLCVFQNPGEYKETKVEIPTPWFQHRELDRIEEAVRDALSRAEEGYSLLPVIEPAHFDNSRNGDIPSLAFANRR